MKNELDKLINDLQLKSNFLKQELLLNRQLKIDVDKSKGFIQLSTKSFSNE